jgi:tetratricopeptide (TPR) repeat protein
VNTPLAQQLSLSTFTPSTMPQATLEGMFVQREQLLQSIVQDLAASIDSTKQYLMLVGARGMGKTHFVSLAYHRLKQKPELKDRLLIAWLREEEYGVNSWLYLIVEILRSLSQEGIDTAEQINKLAGLPAEEKEYQANRVLIEIIGDRTLLIITENIDKLLYGLGKKEQWKFRSFLQENNSCSILATAPKISDDTSKKDNPFYGFFTSIHLPNFTHADAVAMLVKIANLSGNTQLAKFLNTDEGKSRVRALHHLAGGNPRVYALFAQLITEDTLEALLPAVIEMLDKLTPYYQSRVESLGQSDDQQKIVMYLARETRAVTVKEITAQCFISSENTTSNALKQLTQKGFLISTKKGREVYYEISEVLMRLCLEMKNDRYGNLKLCTDFIRIWYGIHELELHLNKLEKEGKFEYIQYFKQALIELQKEEKNDRELYMQALSFYEQGQWANSVKVLDIYLQNHKDSYEAWFKKGVALFKLSKLKEAIESYDFATKIEPNFSEAWFNQGIALCILNKPREAKKSYDRAIATNPKYLEAWNSCGVVLNTLGLYEEARSSCDKAIQINPNYPKAWHNRGDALVYLNKYEESVDSYDRAIDIDNNFYQSWINRSIPLVYSGNYKEAATSLEQAIKINKKSYKAWFLRGILLAILDRYYEAIDSYMRALEINKNSYEAWFNLGISQDVLLQHEEAIRSYDRALELKPDDRAWYLRGITLASLNRYKDANDSYNCAIELRADYKFWHTKAFTLYKWGVDLLDALNAYDEAIRINPDHYPSWFDRGLIYFRLEKYDNVQTEWKEAFKIAKELKTDDISDLIQAFLHGELLPKFQQPAVREILPQILTIYTTAQVLPELGVALTRNLKAIQSPTISDYTATEWLNMWQELGNPHPELALALRMLEAGIKYKQNPTDDRVFLSLPQEMRPLLREALGLEP